MGELSAIHPHEYSNYRMKSTLLRNLRKVSNIDHMLEKCREDPNMTYEECAAYLRRNSIWIDHANEVNKSSRIMNVQGSLPQSSPEKDYNETCRLFHSMAEDGGYFNTYKVFNTRSFRENLSIPDQIWKELEPVMKDKITEIRSKLRKNQPSSNTTAPTSQSSIPKQYPTMTQQDKKVNLVTHMEDLTMDDKEEDTDDDMLMTYAMMTRVTACTMDPPGNTDYLVKEKENTHEVSKDNDLEVRAHFEYSKVPELEDKIYAISDGGADSCILGKFAKVISYTGRHANLVGYDPQTTRTEKVPIVSAYIKVLSSSYGNYPVLLKVHEAPYNPQSTITLLSEYQIREYGLVIDSVARKHKSAHGKQGTQCFQLSQHVYVNFEDRGGLMGFEILPYEDDDE
jgi:hypothetical protein